MGAARDIGPRNETTRTQSPGSLKSRPGQDHRVKTVLTLFSPMRPFLIGRLWRKSGHFQICQFQLSAATSRRILYLRQKLHVDLESDVRVGGQSTTPTPQFSAAGSIRNMRVIKHEVVPFVPVMLLD